MPDPLFDRRSILCAASALLIGISRTQASDNADFDVDSIGRSLTALESSANKLGLPDASLTRSSGNALKANNYYFDGLPRILALIERTSGDPRAASIQADAVAILSQIHLQERVPFAPLPPQTRAPIPTFDGIKKNYRSLFDACTIKPEFLAQVRWYAKFLVNHKDRYSAVETKLAIPWCFIGILHALEASFNFSGHLHNGDPLSAKTVHVPRNRPNPWLPPSDWASSAADALAFEGFVGQTDWSIEHMLYRWEKYNGFGYRIRNLASPYLWSFSDIYKSGKFTSDGRFDRAAVSQQCGAAVMLKYLVQTGAYRAQ